MSGLVDHNFYFWYGMLDAEGNLIGEGDAMISINIPVGRTKLTPKIIEDIKQFIINRDSKISGVVIRNWIEVDPDD